MSPDVGFYEFAKQNLETNRRAPAISFYGGTMDYQTLFDMIDNVADHLYSLGVRQGDAITIHLPNCPQAVAAVYAVAKLGAICNMVHALFPVSLLRESMETAHSRVLITGDHFSECAAVDFADTLLYVHVGAHMGGAYRIGYGLKNRSRKPEQARSFEELERPCGEKALCPDQKALGGTCLFYLQSTGTSGKPKTVMLSHAAANAWEYDVDVYYGHVPQTGKAMLCILPMFHGSGLVLDMHHCVVGKLHQVLVAKFSAPEAVKLLRKYRVAVMTGIPAMYEKLLKVPDFSGARLPALDECFVSGDTVPFDLKVRFDSRLDPSGKRHFLYEGYGMTETVTAICPMGKEHDKRESSGYPLPGCRAAVLRDGEVRAEGEGELLLQANTMMLGYLDRDSSDSFLESAEGRWLRSGDIGRIDEEGYVYCLGRIKDIIIHNGYNVIPSQVETVLCLHPDIEEASVIGVWDAAASTQQIRAFVVLREGAEMPEGLKEFCAARLPQYAVPRTFRSLKELPRNRMAKVDRKALENTA